MSYAEPWPEDVPVIDTDEDAEMEALHALRRERLRHDEPAPAPVAPTAWQPSHPLALALWQQLPESGRGVDYVRAVRMLAESTGAGLWAAQQVALGLVLVGRAYVSPGPSGSSWVGRGNDPRVGAATFRTGAFGGMGS